MFTTFTKATAAVICLIALIAIQIHFFLSLSPQQNTSHYHTSVHDTTLAAGNTAADAVVSELSTGTTVFTQSTRDRLVTLPESRHSRNVSLRSTDIIVSDDDEEGLRYDHVHTVLFFAGVPGSRLFRHPHEDEIIDTVIESQRDKLHRTKIRIVRPDRPAMGHSSPGESPQWLFEQRKYVDTALDMRQLLLLLLLLDQDGDRGDSSKTFSFSVIGFGMGCPHAMAVAAMADDLYGRELDIEFTGAALIDPVGPITLAHGPSAQEDPLDTLPSVCTLQKLVLRVMRDYPSWRSTVREVWSTIARLGLVTPHYHWPTLIGTQCMDEDDRHLLLNKPEWTAVINDTMIEMLRQGPEGYLSEYALLAQEDWGFQMDHLRQVPLLIIEREAAASTMAQRGDFSASERLIKSECKGSYCLFHRHWQQALEFAFASVPKTANKGLIKQPESDKQQQQPEKQQQSQSQQQQSQQSQSHKTTTATTTTTTTTTTTDMAESITEQHQKQDNTRRVVVVGGGLAGLSAVIETVRSGDASVRVVLLEKEGRVGGNSMKASSGINGVLTPAQKKHGIEDRYEWLIEDTLKSGKGRSNKELADTLSRESTAAVAFLEENGVRLDVVSQCGGHSRPRTHRNSLSEDGSIRNVGAEIMGRLRDVCTSSEDVSPRVEIITGATVTDLLTEGEDISQKRIVGVRYTKDGTAHELGASAVILTTGGFAADRSDFLPKYAPQYANLPTTNGDFAAGDGIKMVERADLGTDLVDMSEVQIHPTCFIDPQNPHAKTLFLAAEALRAYGGILIDKLGHRFVNELGPRDDTSAKIFEHCEPEVENGPVTTYMLLNDEGVQGFGEKLLGFYRSKGFIQTYANFSEMVERAGVKTMQLSTLQNTIQTYNECHAGRQEDAYGKKIFPNAFSLNAPIHMMRITPGLHYTMGGLRISKDGQVLRSQHINDKAFDPIPGLFAAGEVTGGVHGRNRLAGNSLLECVVFARKAARLAART